MCTFGGCSSRQSINRYNDLADMGRFLDGLVCSSDLVHRHYLVYQGSDLHAIQCIHYIDEVVPATEGRADDLTMGLVQLADTNVRLVTTGGATHHHSPTLCQGADGVTPCRTAGGVDNHVHPAPLGDV